ncbi:MAG: hypothetical protein CL946_00110 [Ectothiorhodospiraceae bacterium]|nr:hypothetical protein [Ectothiorhodospiraceae bacterium]
MTDRLQILVVNRDSTLSRLLHYAMEQDGYDVNEVPSVDIGIDAAKSGGPIAVFLHLEDHSDTEFETLKAFTKDKIDVPVIVITDQNSMDTAVKAMQAGAFDYLTKPLDLSRIQEILEKVPMPLSATPKATDTISLKKQKTDKYTIIGKSAAIQGVFKLIGAVSITPNDVPVLITGDSGTGKELVARSIHRNSRAPEDPFIAVNCTTLPEELLESEIFGHEPGAFTDATEKRIGKFELAKTGTIFLDEIGDLSLQLQQKLLRVLQEREFSPLGGNVNIPVKARFIFSTNKDIKALVKEEQFREDLYYRISVFDIHIPPLRDRKEDIQPLVDYFIQVYKEQLGKDIVGFSGDVIEKLMKYDFVGNVRELENLIQKAVVLAKNSIIKAEDLEIDQERLEKPKVVFPFRETNFFIERDRMLKQFEVQFTNNLLRLSKGNVSQAAQTCGMTRQNLQRIMNKHGISPDKYRI